MSDINGNLNDLTPHRLVDALEDRIRDLEIEFHRAYWDSQIEATPERDKRRAELELELRRIKGDPLALAAVQKALEDDVHEPLLARQLEVLRLSLTGNQMEESLRSEIVEISSAVESDFATFRPEVAGQRLTENDIRRTLESSNDDDERKQVWAASKEIGSVVADRIRELARLRNKAARDLGFADYYRMSLELQEIPEQWLFDILDEVERLTAEPFQAYKDELDGRLARRFGVSEIYPWHYAEPFFQDAPPEGRVVLDDVFGDASAEALAVDTFERWGIDLLGVMEGSDLYPRERKCQHAFCLDVDRSCRDVRILANIVPGERWVEVMLHESGHAAYDVSLDLDLPFLLRRAAHTFVTEAIALLSGRLARDPEWLIEFAGVDPSEVKELSDGLVKASQAQALLFARWVLVMTHFERGLYSDPEGDLDALWWELVQRYQMVTPPPGRQAPDWAAKIHVAVAPVYYHNYLLGDLLASQLRNTIVREAGGLVGKPAAGEVLKDRLFVHGSALRWDDVVREATGEPLSAQAFAAEFTS